MLFHLDDDPRCLYLMIYLAQKGRNPEKAQDESESVGFRQGAEFHNQSIKSRYTLHLRPKRQVSSSLPKPHQSYSTSVERPLHPLSSPS